ncbi:MAG: acyl carrier protein [Candidatus Makana argininalis]
MNNIKDKVKKIVSKQFGIKKINISNKISLRNDLGADSLDMIELIMSLEENFNIIITDDESEKLNTIKELINLIKSKLKNNL